MLSSEFDIYIFILYNSEKRRRTVRKSVLILAVCLSLIVLGALSNTLVVELNGGRMPVSRSYRLNKPLSDGHVFIDSDTKIPWLGDIIYLPSTITALIGYTVISIGDVLLYVPSLVILFCVVPVYFVEMRNIYAKE